jgi:uncharacterized membrane protein
MLGIVLQALHVLFGITAIMAFIINMVSKDKVKDTIYESQLAWQQWTFVLGAFAYVIAWAVFTQTGSFALVLVAGLFVLYRIGTSIYFYATQSELKRKL